MWNYQAGMSIIRLWRRRLSFENGFESRLEYSYPRDLDDEAPRREEACHAALSI